MKRVLLLVLLAGCSTRGNETRFPPEISTTGVGPFRQLTADETGIRGRPPGLVVPLGDEAVESGMVAGAHLFYASAPAEGAPPDGYEPGPEIDWSFFGPRRISRSAPGEMLGFARGAVVLEASAAFEGEEVFDPWVIVLPDGRARLYYAAEGGIGLAEAPSVDGAFARVGSGPVLGPDPDVRSGSVPRRPSVVALPAGGFFMAYEVGDAIAIASSTDGLAWEHEQVPFLGILPAATPAEVATVSPGAAVAVSPIGRQVIRIYFRSVRDDGTAIIALAATEDGGDRHFDRLAAPVFADGEPGAPAPRIEGPATLLAVTVENVVDDLQRRALVLTVAPGILDFAPEAPDAG